MSWRRLYLIKSAKPMCYIRSKAFILSFQNSARERPMDREKVAEVLLDLMEEGRMKNNTFHLLLQRSVEIIHLHLIIYFKRGLSWSPEDLSFFLQNFIHYYSEDGAAKWDYPQGWQRIFIYAVKKKVFWSQMLLDGQLNRERKNFFLPHIS